MKLQNHCFVLLYQLLKVTKCHEIYRIQFWHYETVGQFLRKSAMCKSHHVHWPDCAQWYDLHSTGKLCRNIHSSIIKLV